MIRKKVQINCEIFAYGKNNPTSQLNKPLTCLKIEQNKTPDEQQVIFRPELFYNYINLRLKNSQ